MASFERGPLASPQARDALSRLIDGFQTLVREHLALAKIELKEDVTRMARSLVLSAAGLPALLAGYMLFMVALALLLALVLPSWAAFGIVALVNIGAGGALTVVFGKKAKETPITLDSTGSELRRDRELLSSLKSRSETRAPEAMVATPADGNGNGHGHGHGHPRVAQVVWSPASDGASAPRDGAARMSAARPQGKAGATAGLEQRSEEPAPGQPVAGATSTPNGEPMIATRVH
jgi:uncharacterized membrane protein YqjE